MENKMEECNKEIKKMYLMSGDKPIMQINNIQDLVRNTHTITT